MHHLQLQIAIALVLIEAGVFAYLSETWTLPILTVLVAVLPLATSWRLPLQESQRFVGALALAMPFTLQWAFTPYEPTHLRVFILYPLAHAGGQYGLALQASYLWVKQPREPWSAAYPLCGVCVLMAAADVQTTAWQSHVFQVVVLAFTLLTAAYFSSARIPLAQVSRQSSRGRLWISLASMGVIFILAVGCSLWLERSWTTLERLYTQWMFRGHGNGEAGFSRHARLGSISDRPSAQDQLPMLRIYSKSEPGYLRGAAFDRYRNGNWLNETLRDVQPAAKQVPAGLGTSSDQMVFQLPGIGVSEISETPPKWRTVEVWPAASLRDALFAPLETEWLTLPQPQLVVDAYGIVYPEDLLADASYTAYSSRDADDIEAPTMKVGTSSSSASVPGKVNLAALTALPEDLDPRVRELADEIFANCPTPELKVVAAAQWFRKNYHYELGIKIPLGQDPMTYFLLRRPAAHCEYFATGTVILLRLAGVPCRYVTGFVSSEYNYFGGYWLARNKDAHAWVEAWLPGRGWVTVESTPSGGVPRAKSSVQPSHLWDDLLLRMQMLRSQLAAGTWRGLLRAVRTIAALFFTTPHGWLMLTGLLAWGVVLWRRHVRFTVRRKYDPISAEFHQLLGELDRRLERLEFRRPAWETLSQFARRLGQHPDPVLQSAAAWYSDYCEVRYQTDSIPLEIQRLKETLPDLLESLKKLPLKPQSHVPVGSPDS
ncbi:MAG: transglutaminase domain-containing protein [Planctomycetota bacterium]